MAWQEEQELVVVHQVEAVVVLDMKIQVVVEEAVLEVHHDHH